MKKRIFLMLFILIALVAVLSSCGHDCSYTEEVEKVDPTCTEAGYRVLKCSECDEKKTEPIVALTHDYVATVTPPTCKTGGYTTYLCSRCQDDKDGAKSEITNPTGKHTYELVPNSTKAPTCDEAGSDTQKCTACGFEQETNLVPKLNHLYTEKTVPEKAPTCTEDGLGMVIKTCDRPGCGKADPSFTPKANQPIQKLGHDLQHTDAYITNSVPATCTTARHDTWGCKRCDYTENADVGQKLGHDLQKTDAYMTSASTPATCTTARHDVWGCKREGCDYTEEADIANTILGHDIEHTDAYLARPEDSIPATCTTARHDTWTCKRANCGYTEEDDVGTSLGCEMTVRVGTVGTADAGQVTPATCYSLEVRKYQCVRHGETGCPSTYENKEEENSYIAHTASANEADCNSAKWCIVCEAAGKTFNEYTTETTCVAGDDCRVCVAEGRTHIFAVATAIHSFTTDTTQLPERVVAATCMEQEHDIFKCKGCGDEFPLNYRGELDESNHNYNEDIVKENVKETCYRVEYNICQCQNKDRNGVQCEETKEYEIGTTYADHTFDETEEPAFFIECTVCGDRFFDTTYKSGVLKDETVDFGDGAELDVTVVGGANDKVTGSDPVQYKEHTEVSNTAASADIVTNSNPDLRDITVVRVVSNNEDVKYTITVNGDKTYDVVGSGFIDLTEIGDITSLTVSSAAEAGAASTDYEATVYFYGEQGTDKAVA